MDSQCQSGTGSWQKAQRVVSRTANTMRTVIPNAEVESAPTWRRERRRRRIGKMLPQREKVRLGSDLERWVRTGAPILPRWGGATN